LTSLHATEAKAEVSVELLSWSQPMSWMMAFAESGVDLQRSVTTLEAATVNDVGSEAI
jgi:hypothetical protein